MESNNTLHESVSVIFAQKFLYTKLVRYHKVMLRGFEAKIVFGAKQPSNILSPDFRLISWAKKSI